MGIKESLKTTAILGILGMTLAFTGCAGVEKPVAEEEKPSEVGFEELEHGGEETIEREDVPSEETGQEEDSTLDEDGLKALNVNEMGKVMIVMYHNLSDEEKDFVRSRENFREDLEILNKKGYRLISVADYIDGNIEVEAGMTPVVFTFDDGPLSNFNAWEENGTMVVDPECAVGMLEAFAQENPDFGKTAAFFLFGTNPFRQSELVDRKLNYLVDNGFEIGSHSFGHDNLSKLDSEGIMKSLGRIDAFIEKTIPGYSVRSLALPYGARPKDDIGRAALREGVHEGNGYLNEAIFAVGWQPERSPIDSKIDFQYLNRVHASNEEFGIRYWLDYFDDHPEARYISDGDPETFTVLAEDEESVSLEMLGDRQLRTYVKD